MDARLGKMANDVQLVNINMAVSKKRNKKVHMPTKSGRSLRNIAAGHQGVIQRSGFMFGGIPNQP